MSTLATLRKRLPRRVTVRKEGSVYVLRGIGEPVYLGVTEAQAAKMLGRILDLPAPKTAQRNPAKRKRAAARPARKRVTARRPSRKNPTRSKAAKRKPVSRSAGRLRKSSRKTRRNPSQIYNLVYYTQGGAKVGTGEWNSDLSGIYGVAQRVMNSDQGRRARIHKAEIYYGPRFVGAIDKDGRIWMSKAVGVK